MRLLPPLTAGRRVVAGEKAAGQQLPYARHVDDPTIEARDGPLMQVIQLRGLLFETTDTDEINYRKGLRDDDVFVRRIKDWEKTIRKRNGIVAFATQSAQDALESRIASAIIEQAATQIRATSGDDPADWIPRLLERV